MPRCKNSVTSADQSCERVLDHSSARARSSPVSSARSCNPSAPTTFGALDLAFEHQEITLIRAASRSAFRSAFRSALAKRAGTPVRDLGDDLAVGALAHHMSRQRYSARREASVHSASRHSPRVVCRGIGSPSDGAVASRFVSRRRSTVSSAGLAAKKILSTVLEDAVDIYCRRRQLQSGLATLDHAVPHVV
jgi:hypothetical protein